MAYKKKEVYKVQPMTDGNRNIIQGLIQEYDIETADDIQAVLRDLLGGTIKETVRLNTRCQFLLKTCEFCKNL